MWKMPRFDKLAYPRERKIYTEENHCVHTEYLNWDNENEWRRDKELDGMNLNDERFWWEFIIL